MMRSMAQSEVDAVKSRIEAVTLTNAAFYKAFESLDISHMDRVWANAEYVTCIHPGWTLRVGWPAVRDSWVLIFNNTFSMTFQLTDLQVQVSEDLGWVICTENIITRQGDESLESRVLATNLYERIDGRWLMIHHHGSPVLG
jgi:ketosteroid isomerase-like protein